MKIVKPDFFDAFCCSADRCGFTCCRDWDIAVDARTMCRWEKEGIFAKKFLRRVDGNTVIKLQKNHFCPFLTKNRLCSLVVKYGEKMISDTCHTYPRENHVFGDRLELSLGMGCPAALELLWMGERFALVEQMDDRSLDRHDHVEESSHGRDNVENPAEAVLLLIRDYFSALIQDEAFSVPEGLWMAFFMILDFAEKKGDISESYIRASFEREPLFKMRDVMSALPRDAYGHIFEQNELFLDIVDSYNKKGMYGEILDPLVNLAGELEAERAQERFLSGRKMFEDVWKQWDRKVRLLLSEECFSSLYLPGGDLDTMVLKVEWLGLTYAVLKQGVFLKWLPEYAVSEQEFTNLVVVVVRMMGYPEEEIREFLENNFQSAVWEWNYMALIV